MHSKLLHNGAVRATDEILLSPGQVGFLNGWGVFSTLRVSNGVLFAFERHYARMAKDALRLHVPFDMAADELERHLLSLVEANRAPDSTLRVAVVRNEGGPFEGPRTGRPAELIAFTTDLTDWGAGAHLSYRPHARYGASPFAGTKYTSWSENLTMYETARQQGFDEYVLLNEHGHVSECTSANLFVLQGDRLWTPPLTTSGCLPGVTRALLLEEISVPGLIAGERELMPSDLESGDAVFMTSSTRDVLPVLTIDREPLRQSPGHLNALRNAFVRHREAYVAARLHQHEPVVS